MSTIDWLDIAIRLYDRGGKKTYHVKDLAEMATTFGLLPPGETEETFSKTLAARLNANSKTKTPQFSRVSNGKGGIRQGTFRIKAQKPINFLTEAPKVTTQFTGSAGEYAVMSELLFRGFNASKMTVDDGIDIVASKGDSYFHVQVKTANDRDGIYTATIKTTAFRHASNVFYIIVLRSSGGVRYVNDFAIIQSGDIKKMMLEGKLKDGPSINLRISSDGGRMILNGGVDISVHRNNWDLIC